MAVMGYRTNDGLAYYGFSIEHDPGIGWRVYIVFLPGGEDHDNGLRLPYRSADAEGRHYVNWTGKLDGLGEARDAAEIWAELAHRHQQDHEKYRYQVKLIERCLRMREERRATTPAPDHAGEAVEDGDAAPRHQESGFVVPRSRVSAESLSDLEESARPNLEVA